MKRATQTLTAILAFTLALAAGANAHLIKLDPESDYDGETYFTSGLRNPRNELAQIEMAMGLAEGTLSYLNKYDVENGWDNEGAVDDSHFGFTLDNEGDGDAWWNLTGTGYQLSYLLLKSGKEHYTLYGVTIDPDQRITSGGWDPFENNPFGSDVAFKNGISHGSFFGVEGPGSTDVPDGGTTLVLLGISVAGFGLLRRKFS